MSDITDTDFLHSPIMDPANRRQLAQNIKQWGLDLGFQQLVITDIHLEECEKRLQQWLADQCHGEMHYMQKHGKKRTRPELLVKNTVRVIIAGINYLNEAQSQASQTLQEQTKGYVSRYALGRDYHKVVRSRLQKLADKIEQQAGKFGYRVFCDSAPIMEKPLAVKGGLGWMGKHTNVLNRENGSWFFLGEIYTNLPLETDQPVVNHCGKCSACMDICPTQAIIAPYVLDARKCISYLTIELHGYIPEVYRQHIGNRIYGCDDCQLACPWNKYAKITVEKDFQTRHNLSNSSLVELFAWDENTFLKNTEGSAIRRIGHKRWLRNIAVAMGNAPYSESVIQALQSRKNHPSRLVREHVTWALQQQQKKNKQTLSVDSKKLT